MVENDGWACRVLSKRWVPEIESQGPSEKVVVGWWYSKLSAELKFCVLHVEGLKIDSAERT